MHQLNTAGKFHIILPVFIGPGLSESTGCGSDNNVAFLNSLYCYVTLTFDHRLPLLFGMPDTSIKLSIAAMSVRSDHKRKAGRNIFRTKKDKGKWNGRLGIQNPAFPDGESNVL